MCVRSIVPLLVAFSVFLVLCEGKSRRHKEEFYHPTATAPARNTTDTPIVTTTLALNINDTSDDRNSTSTSLLQVYRQSQERFRNWLGDPYNHGIIMPAIIGVMAALTTVAMLCCINSCVKTSARRRRRRRIRNLADELKTDRKTLLGKNDDSDDEL